MLSRSRSLALARPPRSPRALQLANNATGMPDAMRNEIAPLLRRLEAKDAMEKRQVILGRTARIESMMKRSRETARHVALARAAAEPSVSRRYRVVVNQYFRPLVRIDEGTNLKSGMNDERMSFWWKHDDLGERFEEDRGGFLDASAEKTYRVAVSSQEEEAIMEEIDEASILERELVSLSSPVFTSSSASASPISDNTTLSVTPSVSKATGTPSTKKKKTTMKQTTPNAAVASSHLTERTTDAAISDPFLPAKAMSSAPHITARVAKPGTPPLTMMDADRETPFTPPDPYRVSAPLSPPELSEVRLVCRKCDTTIQRGARGVHLFSWRTNTHLALNDELADTLAYDIIPPQTLEKRDVWKQAKLACGGCGSHIGTLGLTNARLKPMFKSANVAWRATGTTPAFEEATADANETLRTSMSVRRGGLAPLTNWTESAWGLKTHTKRWVLDSAAIAEALRSPTPPRNMSLADDELPLEYLRSMAVVPLHPRGTSPPIQTLARFQAVGARADALERIASARNAPELVTRYTHWMAVIAKSMERDPQNFIVVFREGDFLPIRLGFAAMAKLAALQAKDPSATVRGIPGGEKLVKVVVDNIIEWDAYRHAYHPPPPATPENFAPFSSFPIEAFDDLEVDAGAGEKSSSSEGTKEQKKKSRSPRDVRAGVSSGEDDAKVDDENNFLEEDSGDSSIRSSANVDQGEESSEEALGGESDGDDDDDDDDEAEEEEEENDEEEEEDDNFAKAERRHAKVNPRLNRRIREVSTRTLTSALLACVRHVKEDDPAKAKRLVEVVAAELAARRHAIGQFAAAFGNSEHAFRLAAEEAGVNLSSPSSKELCAGLAPHPSVAARFGMPLKDNGYVELLCTHESGCDRHATHTPIRRQGGLRSGRIPVRCKDHAGPNYMLSLEGLGGVVSPSRSSSSPAGRNRLDFRILDVPDPQPHLTPYHVPPGHLTLPEGVKVTTVYTHKQLNEVRAIFDDFITKAEEHVASNKGVPSAQFGVGIDVEWRPLFRADSRANLAAVMQIATREHGVFVFDTVTLAPALAPVVKRLLKSDAVMKIGHGLSEDVARIVKCVERASGIEGFSKSVFPVNSVVELAPMYGDAYDVVVTGRSQPSLAKMVFAATGMELDKRCQMTDWERRPLSPAQVTYAAVDAMCAFQVYDAFSKRLELTKRGFNLKRYLSSQDGNHAINQPFGRGPRRDATKDAGKQPGFLRRTRRGAVVQIPAQLAAQPGPVVPGGLPPASPIPLNARRGAAGGSHGVPLFHNGSNPTTTASSSSSRERGGKGGGGGGLSMRVAHHATPPPHVPHTYQARAAAHAQYYAPSGSPYAVHRPSSFSFRGGARGGAGVNYNIVRPPRLPSPPPPEDPKTAELRRSLEEKGVKIDPFASEEGLEMAQRHLEANLRRTIGTSFVSPPLAASPGPSPPLMQQPSGVANGKSK